MARNKLIESPEILLDYFKSYKEETKKFPIKVQDYVGKDGIEVKRERERPLTMEGFESWCFDNGIINDLWDYFSNKNQKYSEFSTICMHIRKVIRQDQIEGGMVGIYNPSITQRLNGLTEKTESKVEITDAPDWLKGEIK
jgi:hypothetical protein